MSRLRLLILPGCLALAAGLAASIALMNAALVTLLLVMLTAATPEERNRFRDAALVLAPWAGGLVLAYLVNFGLPIKSLKFFFAWLSLPLAAAFLPSVSPKQVLGVFFAVLGAASLLGIVQHLEGIGVLETGLCNFTAEAYTGKFNQYLCGFKAGTRARGFFYTPMTFGAVVMFGLLAASILIQREDAPRKFWGASALLQTVALLVSSSRNSWVGFASMLPLALGKRKKAWLIAGIGVLGVAGLVMATPVLRSRVLSFGNVNTDPSSSTGARIFLWKDAWAQFQERPVFGWGPNTFRQNVERRHPEVPLLSTKHAHNSYLHTLAETGLVGLLGMLASLGWIAWRNLRSADPYLRRVALATLGAFFVSGFFEANFLDSEVIINLFFWQALAWGAANKATVSDYGEPASTDVEAPVVAVPS
jgi:O-antigen ligase